MKRFRNLNKGYPLTITEESTEQVTESSSEDCQPAPQPAASPHTPAPPNGRRSPIVRSARACVRNVSHLFKPENSVTSIEGNDAPTKTSKESTSLGAIIPVKQAPITCNKDRVSLDSIISSTGSNKVSLAQSSEYSIATKNWSHGVVTNTIRDGSNLAVPKIRAMKGQSPAMVHNTHASSSSAIPNNRVTMGQSPAMVHNTSSMRNGSSVLVPIITATKDQLRTAVPNNGAIKSTSPVLFPNITATKDQFCTAIPNTGGMITNSGAIKITTVVPITYATKHQSHVPVPNTSAIKNQSSEVVPNTSVKKDQLHPLVPIVRPMKWSHAVVPNTNVMRKLSRTVPSINNSIKKQLCSAHLITSTMEGQSCKMTIEEFTFHEIIGQGAFGKVVLASHPAIDQKLAVKIVPKKLRANLRRAFIELVVLEAVRDHPYITKLYCSFHTKDQLVFAMEYLSRGDLSKMNNISALSNVHAIRNLTAEILCGLQYLHAKEIIHRDLKPENILLDGAGHAKIADFGMSAMGVSKSKKIRGFAGTLAYMAPEVLKGEPYYTMADYFSLGVMLYQVVVGKHPFYKDQDTKEKMLWAVLDKKLYYPMSMDRHLYDLINRLLCPNQDWRSGLVTGLREHPFFTLINWAQIEEGTSPSSRC